MDLEARLEAIEKDLYRGNGKQSYSTRLTVVENDLATLSKNSGWIVKLVITTLLMVAGDILVKVLSK